MHPPLFKPHPDCEKLVESLVECHKENPYKKFLGACNEVKFTMDECFKVTKCFAINFHIISYCHFFFKYLNLFLNAVNI